MDIDAEKDSIQEFVDRGNFHAAMNIAISALNDCRRKEDLAGIELFLDVIHDIANTMTEKFAGE